MPLPPVRRVTHAALPGEVVGQFAPQFTALIA